MPEKTYYQDSRVTISDKRVRIDGAAFSMDGITSARLVTRSPRILWPSIVLAIGIAGILAGAIIACRDGGPACLVVAMVPALLGGLGLFRVRARHYVVTRSASVPIPEMQFDDPAYGRRIVHALNEAIVARESEGQVSEQMR